MGLKDTIIKSLEMRLSSQEELVSVLNRKTSAQDSLIAAQELLIKITNITNQKGKLTPNEIRALAQSAFDEAFRVLTEEDKSVCCQ